MTEPRNVQPGDRFLRLPEVSNRTGFKERTLRTMAYEQRKGKSNGCTPIPFKKLGRFLGCLESELDRWLAENIREAG